MRAATRSGSRGRLIHLSRYTPSAKRIPCRWINYLATIKTIYINTNQEILGKTLSSCLRSVVLQFRHIQGPKVLP